MVKFDGHMTEAYIAAFRELDDDRIATGVARKVIEFLNGKAVSFWIDCFL